MPLSKLLINVTPEAALQMGELLFELGAGGVEERATATGVELIVYGCSETELRTLGERSKAAVQDLNDEALVRAFAWRVQTDGESDWETNWTQYLVQQPLTPHWVIQPEGDTSAPPSDKGVIFFHPVLAFGDGSHVTTRMAATAIETACRERAGCSLLDIGTGTGVLAMVAVLSGAARVVGTDIDPVALAAAARNAELNHLAGRIELLEPSAPLPPQFDLVVANLEPRTLLELAGPIAAQAQQAFQLIVTGFLSEQATAVATALGQHGFSVIGRIDEDGWCLLILSSAFSDERLDPCRP